MGASIEQTKRIYTLFSLLGIKDRERQREMIGHSSANALSGKEADALIDGMQQLVNKSYPNTEALRMKRKMFSRAYEMGYGSPANSKETFKHLDNWARKYGYLHKGLNAYSAGELPELLTQYERVYESFLKGV